MVLMPIAASMKTLPSHKVLVMIFWWLAVFSLVCQASIVAQNATLLQRRQCVKDPATGQWDCDFNLPTMLEIVDRYRDTNDGGGAEAHRPVWFYTNLDLDTNNVASIALCRGWMLSNQLDGYYLMSGISLEWYHEQSDFIWEYRDRFRLAAAGQDPQDIFGICMFEALAISALHPEAYVFTKEAPETWRIGSMWEVVEFPALTSNPNIQRIYRVDPRPGHCNQRRLIWDRRINPELRTIKTCPVLQPLQMPEPAASQSQSTS